MFRKGLVVAVALFSVLNVIALVINMTSPSKAAIAGMKSQALQNDPDFAKAVKATIEKCRVNIELAKIVC
jgi:hypothetical protein